MFKDKYRECLSDLEKRKTEILRELDSLAYSIAKEYSGVDKETLKNIRELMSDYYNACNNMEKNLNDYSNKSEETYHAFIKSLEKARTVFEKDIQNHVDSYIMDEYAKERLVQIVNDTAPYTIVQETGDREDLVMSQKATTDFVNGEVGKLSEDIADVKDEMKIAHRNQPVFTAEFVNGEFVNNVGGLTPDPAAKRTDYIPTYGFTHYFVDVFISSDGCSIAFYDHNKQFIDAQKTIGEAKGCGEIPADASYVVFSHYGGGGYASLINNDTVNNNLYEIGNMLSKFRMSNNLYDKTIPVEDGYYYADVFYPSESFKTITIILPKKCEKLIAHYIHNYVSYYDAYDNYITTDSDIMGYDAVCSPPAACRKVKITVQVGSVSFNSYYVCEGESLPSVIEPFGYYDPHNLSIPRDLAVNRLQGKKIMFFGDSITNSGHMYRTPLVRNTGMTEVGCFAVDGATIRNHEDTVMDGNPTYYNNNTVPNQVQKLLNNISSYEVPDIIIISASTNDWATGNEYDETQFTNQSGFIDVDTLNLKQNFTGCMRWMYEKLTGVYPNAKVFFATPLQSTVTDRDYATQKQKRNCIVSVCNRMSCPYIDAFYNSGVYDVKASKHLYDGLHPHEVGGELLAKCYEMELINKYI